MNKKIIITTITTIIITLLFIIAKNLIYGTDTYYIADYMPSFSMKIEIQLFLVILVVLMDLQV